MSIPLNQRTVSLRLKRIDVCDFILACHNASLCAIAMGERGENKWDRLGDVLDRILTDFDKQQDVMM